LEYAGGICEIKTDMFLHKWNIMEILPAEIHWDYPLENLEGHFFVKENVVKSFAPW